MKAVSLLLFFSLNAAIAQPPAAWTPEYSLQVQIVSAVTPSPDGKVVAWAQSKTRVDAEHSEQISQIFVSRGEKGASSPAFSPDRSYVYFTYDLSRAEVYSRCRLASLGLGG